MMRCIPFNGTGMIFQVVAQAEGDVIVKDTFRVNVSYAVVVILFSPVRQGIIAVTAL